MANFNSLLYKPKITRVYKDKIKLLNGCPQKLGLVTKAILRSPKKPHSAKRATVKFHLIGKKQKKIIVTLMVWAADILVTQPTISYYLEEAAGGIYPL